MKIVKNVDKYANKAFWGLFFLLVLIMHINFRICGDDLWLLEKTASEVLNIRLVDSGRVLPDLLAWAFVHMPMKIWKLCDCVVFSLIPILFTYLLGYKENKNMFAVCLLTITFPFQILSTAGYIATTTNYLFTFVSLLLACIPFKSVLDGKKIRLFNICCFIPALYTTQHDQSALAMIFFAFIMVVFCIVNKKSLWNTVFVSVELLVSILSYGFYYFSPGHMHRASYIGNWIPGYDSWSIFDKLYHGYTSTVVYAFYRNIPIILVFITLLFIVSIVRKNKVMITLSSIVFFTEIIILMSGKLPAYEMNDITLGMPSLGSLDKWQNIFWLVLSIVLAICIFVSVWMTFEGMQEKVTMLTVLLVGAGLRVAMGFSETLYFSSYRTYTIFIFAIIFVACGVVKEIFKEKNEFANGMCVAILVTGAVVQYSDSLVSLI